MKIKCGLVNVKKNFITEIAIDNTPPAAIFNEISSSDGKSTAKLTLSEPLRPVNGWDSSSFGLVLSKEFFNPISYLLPITDFAQNSSEILIDIKNATAISLTYGTYDAYSALSIVTAGKISTPNTISSNSICKAESLFINLSSSLNSNILLGRAYVHTYWGENASAICRHSGISYYHGYNPVSSSGWLHVGRERIAHFRENVFSQLGGIGMNHTTTTSSAVFSPIPPEIAQQYLFGISSIQFKFENDCNLSVVYQSYLKDIGWLKVSSDGEENGYQQDKPISSLRINIVPRTEKQHFIDFWNRDIGTSHIN